MMIIDDVLYRKKKEVVQKVMKSSIPRVPWFILNNHTKYFVLSV